MRVGGPSGIELGESTIRPGSYVFARPAFPVMPTVSIAAAGPLTSASAIAVAVLSAGLTAAIAAASAPRALYVVPALLACASAALFAMRKWLLPPIAERAAERRLLQLAAIRHGEFSLPDAALVLNTSLEQADATLTSLARKGHVELRVDESKGAVRYRFRDVGSHHAR